MKEFLNKLRKYEIQIRKTIDSRMQGDFHSLFKGSGLTFDDLRPYQYGDEIRSIDWNTSAKGHGTFVKTYAEEKEQTIYFLVDTSSSHEIGRLGNTKADKIKEICGVLTLSGIKESAHVGLICFSDQKEIYLPAKKGPSQGYQIIYQLLHLRPKSIKTNLNAAILFMLQTIKRRSVIIILSDFIDTDYFHSLKALAKKHDVVLIQVNDKLETTWPNLGIIPIVDVESKKTHWINSNFGYFRNQVATHHQRRNNTLKDLARKYQVDRICVQTSEDYVPKLLQLFKVRNKKTKKSVL